MITDKATVRLHLPYLDGLRGIACLAVILHHCVFHGARLNFGISYIDWMPRLLNLGYSGVELFFVLSGFCLALPMFRPEYRFAPKDYFSSRIRRLYPAYVIVLAILVLYGYLMAVIAPGSPFQVIPKPTFGDIVAGLLMIRTWGNTVFWTLLIELRWYCLLPLVVAALKWVDTTFSKRFLGASVVLGLSVVVAYVYDRFGLHIDGVPGKLLFVIGPIPLYLPVLVSGVVIAQLHSELGKAKSLIKVIGTLAGIVLFVYSLTQFPQDPTTFSPMKRLLFSGLAATVLFVILVVNQPLQSLCSLPMFVKFGGVSYTAYLIHLPIIHIFRQVWPSASMSTSLAGLIYYVVLPAGLVLLSFPVHAMIEKPFLARKVS